MLPEEQKSKAAHNSS